MHERAGQTNLTSLFGFKLRTRLALRHTRLPELLEFYMAAYNLGAASYVSATGI